MKRIPCFASAAVLPLFAGLLMFVSSPASSQHSKLRTADSSTLNIPRQAMSVTAPQLPIQKFVTDDLPWDKNLVLPDTSDRIVRYTMDVKLDTVSNIISGWELLEWRNETGKPQRNFPMHLYHNAWKNSLSTYAKEDTYRIESLASEKDCGYTNIKRAVWISPKREIDITKSFTYIHPDDTTSDDQTVCQLTTPKSILPGKTLKLKIEFETKQPRPVSRTGVVRNYHFVAQWFPKIGVWWKGNWNCHQFHANTEFFADYGVYNVKITVPSEYIVGACGGMAKAITNNSDGTATHQFIQEDIHDFAWVTAPDLVPIVRTFSHIHQEPDERSDRHHPLKEVTVILLAQPQHQTLADRYFDATFKALRYYGEWYGEYPYETITVVDPANGSRSGGMEYPTLFAGGTTIFAPNEESSPEGVTVHEFGHQFWYALVGSNEFEEAWLDEGFTTYSTDRVMRYGWKPFKRIQYYFGKWGWDGYVGIPLVIDEMDDMDLLALNADVREEGKNDVMMRRGWEYNGTYGINSYTKPALSLVMLERTLGEEMMYRVMRTYHFRYRFKHPTTQDFINTVNEVTGRDMMWFFRNTWYSSDLFDYSVDRITNRQPSPEGLFNINGGPHDTAKSVPASYKYECEIVIKREGEAVAPVDVLVSFKNGDERRETWDGQYRWKKYVYQTNSPVASVVVDPEHRLVLDVNWNNNSKVVRPPGFVSAAAQKIASRFMFWVQNYFNFLNYGL